MNRSWSRWQTPHILPILLELYQDGHDGQARVVLCNFRVEKCKELSKSRRGRSNNYGLGVTTFFFVKDLNPRALCIHAIFNKDGCQKVVKSNLFMVLLDLPYYQSAVKVLNEKAFSPALTGSLRACWIMHQDRACSQELKPLILASFHVRLLPSLAKAPALSTLSRLYWTMLLRLCSRMAFIDGSKILGVIEKIMLTGTYEPALVLSASAISRSWSCLWRIRKCSLWLRSWGSSVKRIKISASVILDCPMVYASRWRRSLLTVSATDYYSKIR